MPRTRRTASRVTVFRARGHGFCGINVIGVLGSMQVDRVSVVLTMIICSRNANRTRIATHLCVCAPITRITTS